jgi:hypothetical protein
MCNLYSSVTKNQAAIRNLFKVDRDSSGNLPAMPGIFPRQAGAHRPQHRGVRELALVRGACRHLLRRYSRLRTRAGKLEAKGKTVDFKELLRMEAGAWPQRTHDQHYDASGSSHGTGCIRLKEAAN